GRGVGIALGPGMYSMVSTGGLALSRVSKRFVVPLIDSSPNKSQPKLLAGLPSHDCTSATICAELQVYCPTGPTDWFALTVGEKMETSAITGVTLSRIVLVESVVLGRGDTDHCRARGTSDDAAKCACNCYCK